MINNNVNPEDRNKICIQCRAISTKGIHAVLSQTPIRKVTVNNMAGKKETPPKRETGFLCTFRISGVSNNLLRREMIKIRGMIIRARITAVRKPEKIKTMFSSMLYLVSNVFRKFQAIIILFSPLFINKPAPFIKIFNNRTDVIFQ